jgi:hypothetical protein
MPLDTTPAFNRYYRIPPPNTEGANKVKDFDSIIPGHGGFTDRMDCQMLMSLFVWVRCVALPVEAVLALERYDGRSPFVEHRQFTIISSLMAYAVAGGVPSLVASSF